MLRYPISPKKLKQLHSNTHEEEIIEDENGEIIGVKGHVAKIARSIKAKNPFWDQRNSSIQRSASTNRCGYQERVGFPRVSNVTKSYVGSLDLTGRARVRNASGGRKPSRTRSEYGDYEARSSVRENNANGGVVQGSYCSRCGSCQNEGMERQEESRIDSRSYGFRESERNIYIEDNDPSTKEDFTERQTSVNELLGFFGNSRRQSIGKSQTRDSYERYREQSNNPSVRHLLLGEEVNISRDRNGMSEIHHHGVRNDQRVTLIDSELHTSLRTDGFLRSRWEDSDDHDDGNNQNEVAKDDEAVLCESWEVVHTIPYVYDYGYHDQDEEHDSTTIHQSLSGHWKTYPRPSSQDQSSRRSDDTFMVGNDNQGENNAFYLAEENPVYTSRRDWREIIARNRLRKY